MPYQQDKYCVYCGAYIPYREVQYQPVPGILEVPGAICCRPCSSYYRADPADPPLADGPPQPSIVTCDLCCFPTEWNVEEGEKFNGQYHVYCEACEQLSVEDVKDLFFGGGG